MFGRHVAIKKRHALLRAVGKAAVLIVTSYLSQGLSNLLAKQLLHVLRPQSELLGCNRPIYEFRGIAGLLPGYLDPLIPELFYLLGPVRHNAPYYRPVGA